MASTSSERIRIGNFNSRVTILQPVVAGSVRTWSPLITVWADITSTSNIDRPAGLGPPDIATTQIRIRYMPSIRVRPRMRLSLKDGRLLEIVAAPSAGEKNRVVLITAKEVTS